MRRMCALTTGLMLVSLPAMAGRESTPRDPLQTKLETNVQDYTLREGSFVQALAHVATEFEIPMGIEWIRDPPSLKRVDLSWKRATVLEIIELIAKTQTDYGVDIRDGVVHVYPLSFASSPHNFLNLRISEFSTASRPAAWASAGLQTMVRGIVSPKPPALPAHEARSGGMIGSFMLAFGERTPTFHLKSATVREILDNLASADGRSIWDVAFSNSQDLTTTRYRRTVWPDGTTPSDERQPSWSLYLWGMDPVSNQPRQDWKPQVIAPEAQGPAK